MEFIVYFEFMSERFQRNTPDHEQWALDDIKDGFWLTKDMNLCRASQGHYWVPPSRILLVEHRTG